MHKLPKLIEIMFNRVSVERLLYNNADNKIYYDHISLAYLQDLMLTYDKSLSDTELRLQLKEINYQTESEALEKSMNGNAVNVFSVLCFYIPKLLTVQDNHCVVKYAKLLEWNQLAKVVGEDILITSYMAKKDLDNGRLRENFFWAPVIGHNNVQLNKILQRGMAENHFHLKGSAPYFYLNWINLMNNPERAEFSENFEWIESNYRDKEKKSEAGIMRQPLRNLILEAALIRLYLCSKLAEFPIKISPYRLTFQEIKRKIDYEAFERFSKDHAEKTKKHYSIEEIQNYVSKFKYEELYTFETEKAVERLVSDNFEMEDKLVLIQAEIDSLKFFSGEADYMQMCFREKSFASEKEYHAFTGERWFLYTMFKSVYIADKRFTRNDYNLFYAYLRIQNELRNELIQINDLVGFENFEIYQDRKTSFVHLDNKRESEGKLVRLAVRDVLNNPAVKHLEVRISPGNSAEENAETIKAYDYAVQKGDKEEQELQKKYHYVMHFIKSPDQSETDFEFPECRHFRYRKNVQRIAEEIIRFREEYPEQAGRLVGIDASSQEIGCRPEVFGKVFRALKDHTVPYSEIEDNKELPQLKITYHVGEDYLDIVDGLRAIEEAVRFLNMDCGDRLGHALALGTDADFWYRMKGKNITLPLQDYLDNIVWFYQKLIKYNVRGMSSLKGWLESKYSQYFFKIYGDCISEIQSIQKDSRIKQQGYIDMHTYYLAWLLRGDDPSMYKYGKFEREPRWIDYWEKYSANRSLMKKGDIRETGEIALLYHLYHYNSNVRKKGSVVKTFELSDIYDIYIEGVKAVQAGMREEILKRGISIETNPSSNLSIGVINGMAKHPIKTFYNKGLTYNEKELMECPQLNVSINTDDKGVFATRLENEYALLACSMEQERDEEGKPKYRKEFIYDWLDNIRDMGLRQVFNSERKEF